MGQCLTKSDEDEQPSYQLTATSNNESLFGGQRAFYDKESDIIINGYLKFSDENDDEYYDVFLPKDIMWLISTYLLTSLTVKNSTICTLESGRQYLFDSLVLEPWSVLTVNGYDSKKKEGGILYIRCKNSLILHEGASINMNGRGYHSGERHQSIKHDLKGSNKSLLQSQYKLKCGDGHHEEITNKKSKLANVNGNGGGCIYIECDEFICKNGNILACGHKGYTIKTQWNGGYGGDINILINKKCEISEKSKILAIGLADKKDYQYFGEIKIICANDHRDKFKSKMIEYPSSYSGLEAPQNKNISPQPVFSSLPNK